MDREFTIGEIKVSRSLLENSREKMTKKNGALDQDKIKTIAKHLNIKFKSFVSKTELIDLILKALDTYQVDSIPDTVRRHFDLKIDVDWNKLQKRELPYEDLFKFCIRARLDVTSQMSYEEVANILIDEYNKTYCDDEDFVQIKRMVKPMRNRYYQIRHDGTMETVIEEVVGEQHTIVEKRRVVVGEFIPIENHTPVARSVIQGDEIKLRVNDKEITISPIRLSKNIKDGGYTSSEILSFCLTLEIRGMNTTSRLVELVRREKMRQFGSEEEKRDVKFLEQEEMIVEQDRRMKRMAENLRNTEKRMRDLEDELESVKIRNREIEHRLLIQTDPIYRTCLVRGDTEVSKQQARTPGDTTTDLTGQEFRKVIESIRSYDKKNLDFIRVLSRELSISNPPFEEDYKLGIQKYAERCQVGDMEWDPEYETSDDEEDESKGALQVKLLNILKRQNPGAYNCIIGKAFDLLTVQKQVNQTPGKANEYNVKDPYYITDLIDFLKANRFYSSPKRLIDVILPLISRCIRFYIDYNGNVYCLYKLNSDKPTVRVLADKMEKIYKKEFDVSVVYNDEKDRQVEKTKNILKWGRQLSQLSCTDKFLVDTTPKEVVTVECYNWQLIFEIQEIKLDVDMFFVHAANIYREFDRLNSGKYNSQIAFDKQILSREESFEKAGRICINDRKAKTYNIKGLMREKIKIKDGENIFSYHDFIRLSR